MVVPFEERPPFAGCAGAASAEQMEGWGAEDSGSRMLDTWWGFLMVSRHFKSVPVLVQACVWDLLALIQLGRMVS